MRCTGAGKAALPPIGSSVRCTAAAVGAGLFVDSYYSAVGLSTVGFFVIHQRGNSTDFKQRLL